MEQFTVTDKYRKKRTIKGWNKPTIWLCNQNPFNYDERAAGIDYDWLKGNTVVVKIDGPLYDKDAPPPAAAPAAPEAPRAQTPMQVDEDRAEAVQSTPSQWPPTPGPAPAPVEEEGPLAGARYWEDISSQPIVNIRRREKEPEPAPKENVNLHNWFK